MKELIPMNDYGIFADGKDTARANSLVVAKIFGKQHKHVLDSLQKITQPKNGLSDEFRRRNFAQSSYMDKIKKDIPKRIPLIMMICNYYIPACVLRSCSYDLYSAVSCNPMICRYHL